MNEMESRLEKANKMQLLSLIRKLNLHQTENSLISELQLAKEVQDSTRVIDKYKEINRIQVYLDLAQVKERNRQLFLSSRKSTRSVKPVGALDGIKYVHIPYIPDAVSQSVSLPPTDEIVKSDENNMTMDFDVNAVVEELWTKSNGINQKPEETQSVEQEHEQPSVLSKDEKEDGDGDEDEDQDEDNNIVNNPIVEGSADCAIESKENESMIDEDNKFWEDAFDMDMELDEVNPEDLEQQQQQCDETNNIDDSDKNNNNTIEVHSTSLDSHPNPSHAAEAISCSLDTNVKESVQICEDGEKKQEFKILSTEDFDDDFVASLMNKMLPLNEPQQSKLLKQNNKKKLTDALSVEEKLIRKKAREAKKLAKLLKKQQGPAKRGRKKKNPDGIQNNNNSNGNGNLNGSAVATLSGSDLEVVVGSLFNGLNGQPQHSVPNRCLAVCPPLSYPDSKTVANVGATSSLPNIVHYSLISDKSLLFAGVTVSSDARHVLGRFEDGMCKLWDLESCKPQTGFGASVLEHNAMHMVPGSTTSDGKGNGIETIFYHSSMVTTSKIIDSSDNDGQNVHFFTATVDGQVRLWDSLHPEGVQYCWFSAHEPNPIWTIDHCFETSMFATGSADKLVKLWRVDCDIVVQSFFGHTQDVESVSFHPSNRYLASSSLDQTVRLWEINSGRCVRILFGADAPVVHIQTDSSGYYMVGATNSGDIITWDIRSSRILNKWKHETDGDSNAAIRSISLSQDGTLLMSADSNNVVCTWDLLSPDPLMTRTSWIQADIAAAHITPRNLFCTVSTSSL